MGNLHPTKSFFWLQFSNWHGASGKRFGIQDFDFSEQKATFFQWIRKTIRQWGLISNQQWFAASSRAGHATHGWTLMCNLGHCDNVPNFLSIAVLDWKFGTPDVLHFISTYIFFSKSGVPRFFFATSPCRYYIRAFSPSSWKPRKIVLSVVVLREFFGGVDSDSYGIKLVSKQYPPWN